jgi:tail tube GTA-gp10-like protein
MANHARGETDLVIAGKSYRVAMSMGALAGIMDALGVETFEALQERIQACRPRDMVPVTMALLQGNGHDVPEAEVKAMPWQDYFSQVMPAIFPPAPAGEKSAEVAPSRPQKRQKPAA